MREDIAGGLKNALDKGENLENAIKSFINAGYLEKEVRDASRYVSQGTLESLQKIKSLKIKPEKPLIKKLEKPRTSKRGKSRKKTKISGKIIFLSGSLLILIGILTISIIFRAKLLEFFATKF